MLNQSKKCLEGGWSQRWSGYRTYGLETKNCGLKFFVSGDCIERPDTEAPEGPTEDTRGPGNEKSK